MPSPFPGMDPYLEERHLWAGFHNSLADEICKSLNRDLPKPYWSQMEMRSEIGIGSDRPKDTYADVSVHAHSGTARSPALPPNPGEQAAVLDHPRTEVTSTRRVRVSVELYHVASVEIWDPREGRELVTVIEILSPSNKRKGPDRSSYLRKRRRLLAGNVSLVEIDLLRQGQRLWSQERGAIDLPPIPEPVDYLVVVNRSWHRGDEFAFDVFPIAVTEILPVIPVPLREGDAEATLDLQFCFQLAYDGGPYRRGVIDYQQPPAPPLPESLEPWRAERVAAWLGIAPGE